MVNLGPAAVPTFDFPAEEVEEVAGNDENKSEKSAAGFLAAAELFVAGSGEL